MWLLLRHTYCAVAMETGVGGAVIDILVTPLSSVASVTVTCVARYPILEREEEAGRRWRRRRLRRVKRRKHTLFSLDHIAMPP